MHIGSVLDNIFDEFLNKIIDLFFASFMLTSSHAMIDEGKPLKPLDCDSDKPRG